MSEDIFADVPKEGSEDPFGDLDRAIQSESQPEKEPEVEKPEEGEEVPDEEPNTPEEKDLPFHQHPRWIERENELKALKEKEAEHERLIADLALRQQSKSSDVPAWFVELYGDNPVAWEKYNEYDQVKREEIKREILEEQQAQQQKAIEEETKWNNYIEDGFKGLEQSGNKFSRNELGKFMLDNPITDEDGNLDFQKSYNLFQKLNSKQPDHKSEVRKQIADSTTKSSQAGEKKSKDYLTPNDLRYKNWDSLGS